MNSKSICLMSGVHLVGITHIDLPMDIISHFTVDNHRIAFVPIGGLTAQKSVNALKHFAIEHEFIVFIVASFPVAKTPPRLFEQDVSTIMDIDGWSKEVTITKCQNGPIGNFPLYEA